MNDSLSYASILAQVESSLTALHDNESSNHVQKKMILCCKLLNSCLENKKIEGPTTSYSETHKLQIVKSENNEKDLKVVLFDDIIGNDDAKQSIFENIILPFRMPRERQLQIYSGIRQQPANILLYGPPGTGKTILVEAAAHEAGATLFTMRPSEILSMYQGESEKHLRNVFEKARATQRAIRFFDGKISYSYFYYYDKTCVLYS